MFRWDWNSLKIPGMSHHQVRIDTFPDTFLPLSHPISSNFAVAAEPPSPKPCILSFLGIPKKIQTSKSLEQFIMIIHNSSFCSGVAVLFYKPSIAISFFDHSPTAWNNSSWVPARATKSSMRFANSWNLRDLKYPF